MNVTLATSLLAFVLIACGGSTATPPWVGTWSCLYDPDGGTGTSSGGEWIVSGSVATRPSPLVCPTATIDSETLTLNGGALIIREHLTYHYAAGATYVAISTCTKS